MAEQGNITALRKALIAAKGNFGSIGANALEGELNLDAVAMICASMSARMDAALASPARNCDVGTAEEQQARHYAWCRKHGIDGDNKVNCANPDMSCDLCAIRWAQMPYEGKEKDNG